MDAEELKALMLHMFEVARKEVPEKVKHDMLAKGGRITKSDFKRFFEEELVSRIEMHQIAQMQEKVKRTDVADNYDMDEELGSGQTARVFLGTSTETGENYAIKIIDKEKTGA